MAKTDKTAQDLFKLKIKQDLKRHEMNMIELEYSRESELIKHQHEMERQRIKSAEIRKMQERKAMQNYGR